MAIPAQRGSATAAKRGAGSSSPLTLTKPTGVVEGDLLLITAVSDQDGTISTVSTPTGGGTWTLLADNAASTGDQRTFWRIAEGSEPSSYSVPVASVSDCAAVLVAYQVDTFDSTSPLGTAVTGGSTSSSTSHVAPSVTGVTDGVLLCLICATAATNVNRSYTAPSGMTELYDTGQTINDPQWVDVGVFAVTLTAGGATGTKTATCSGTCAHRSTSVVINPAAASTSSGSGTSTWSFTGTGSGEHVASGAGSGSFAFTGSGSGSAPRGGSGASSWSFTGTGGGAGANGGSGADTWSFTGTGGGSAPPFSAYFEPPTENVSFVMAGRALIGQEPYGMSVWRSGGVWHTGHAPSADDLADADRFYSGGRRHPLTDAEYVELIDAGFADYIAT